MRDDARPSAFSAVPFSGLPVSLFAHRIPQQVMYHTLKKKIVNSYLTDGPEYSIHGPHGGDAIVCMMRLSLPTDLSMGFSVHEIPQRLIKLGNRPLFKSKPGRMQPTLSLSFQLVLCM